MAEAHTGTVTLLFTDLERSTELLQELGDEKARALWRPLFRLLREAVAAHGGQEVKNLGDGLMVVFGSAVDALACAVAMQQKVYRHNQRQEQAHRLQVRVGLHVGEPIRDDEDYFGMPVVVAGRLCDHAQGTQILVSDLVRRLVDPRGRYTFRDLGLLSLKGVTEPLSAYEVVWESAVEDLAVSFPLPPLLASIERSTFVGRGREMEQLRQYWVRAREGQRQMLLLAGEPGIGKTRLAAEFAFAAHADGATVLYGRTEEGAAFPYQPFVEALRHYVAGCPLEVLREQLGTAGPELTGLVPELAQRLPDLPEPQPADPDIERYRLFNAFAALLVEASRAGPIVVVLDDLHWADRQTSQLLKRVMRSTEQSPLLIVGAYRETELPATHPFSEALADLRRDRVFDRISLEGLEEEDVGALIGARVGHEAPPEFIRAVHEQTEGNPFFIEEVLRHLEEIGAIYERGGRWMTGVTIDEMGIPEGVKEVIERRLLLLSEECNSVLTVASVIGREFGLDADAMRRASDLSDDRLLELLEEAVAARVITEVPHIVGRYSFSHALVHEALYDKLTTTRRVRLHGLTLQYADNDGVKLAYEVLGGSGPYLVAVGLSNCPALRPQSRVIGRHWERMSRHCRVILYDRRGVGFSAAPEEGYDLSPTLEDLRAVLDAVGARRTVVWGLTDGGPIAIAFAVKYPERVAGLILGGTTPRLLSADDFPWGINRAAWSSFIQTDSSDRGRAVSELTRTRQRSEGAEATGEVMRHIPADVWYKILSAIGTADARTLLAQVVAPTLIVHDPGNPYIPVEAAHYMHEHIPGSKLDVTDEYGESCTEALFGRVETFIEQVTAGDPPRS